VNDQIYSGRSSGFVRFIYFPMFCCSLFWLFIGCNLLVLDINNMFWYCVLHSFRHLVNHIVFVLQFNFGLCLTSHLYLKNIFMPFKFVAAILMCSLCLLISSSSSTYHVTSPFLVLFILKTSNDLSIGSVLIFPSFTSYLSITV